MSYSVSDVSLDGLHALWKDTANYLNWPFPFVLPPWLDAWWEYFGNGNKPHVQVVRDGENIIGIAPLMLREKTITFLGNTDVCDYQDFIIKTGAEETFFTGILDGLKASGLLKLELKHVRPDSHVMNSLSRYTKSRGYLFSAMKEETSVEINLPGDFESYLELLSSKQRHEVRRKMRRLNEAGNTSYRLHEKPEEIQGLLDVFFTMFVESRDDKASFLTPQMKDFFVTLTDKLSRAGILKLGVLELDDLKVAIVICFDYNNCRYLYNCGYNPEYTRLSVGVASKVFTIRDGIEKKLKIFDFLKGNEAYKYHLGGKDVPLYRCSIELT